MEPMQLLIMSSCSDCSTDCFLHVDCRRSESQKALPSSGGGELGAPHQASATASTLKRTCWQCSLLRVNIGAADKNCLNNVADEVASLILWKPRWECADNFTHSSNTAQARMAQAYEQAKASQPALKLAATTSRQQHTGKTNLDRQGQLVSDELKPERTLWCQPGLKRLIHIDPDDYMLAFKDGLGVQCERFASPLVFNPEMQQYYSPPWTPDGMDKAMK